MEKYDEIRRLQGKYNLTAKMSLSVYIVAFKSPIFKLPNMN